MLGAVWFGTSNAAREIVAERSIYLRERMVNLGLINYVLSKYLLLAVFCVLQCTCLLGIVFPALGLPGGGQAFAEMLGALIRDLAQRRRARSPFVDGRRPRPKRPWPSRPSRSSPQVVLGGLIVPMSSTPRYIRALMQAMPARWGFEGAISPNRLALVTDDAWLVDLGQKGLKGEYIDSSGKVQVARSRSSRRTRCRARGASPPTIRRGCRTPCSAAWRSS